MSEMVFYLWLNRHPWPLSSLTPPYPILKLPHSPLLLPPRIVSIFTSPIPISKKQEIYHPSSLFLAPPQLTKHVQLRRQQHCKFRFCTPTQPAIRAYNQRVAALEDMAMIKARVGAMV